MTNREFYTYCRDNRKSSDSLAKREALRTVYDFMRECGTSKDGIKMFIDRMIYESRGLHYDLEAYQWLLSVFEGPSLKSKGPNEQMTLF
jgi:hypothetical protein